LLYNSTYISHKTNKNKEKARACWTASVRERFSEITKIRVHPRKKSGALQKLLKLRACLEPAGNRTDATIKETKGHKRESSTTPTKRTEPVESVLIQ
jgi:hypothetical protein